jgi:hypothetical protein
MPHFTFGEALRLACPAVIYVVMLKAQKSEILKRRVAGIMIDVRKLAALFGLDVTYEIAEATPAMRCDEDLALDRLADSGSGHDLS